MGLPTPEDVGLSIVLRGSFNPAIFQPAWFAHQGLISQSQADATEVDIIAQQITQYKLDSTILQATPDIFSLTSDGEAIEDVLKDMAVGTFRILRHTPLTMVGINRSAHLRTNGEAKWHQIGHALAPKEFWRPITQSPGMQSLTIRGRRDDQFNGFIDITVQPSVRLAFGLYVLVNDHIQIADTSKRVDALEVIDALDANWAPASERTSRVLNRIEELL